MAEIWPFGFEKGKRVIISGKIFNDGTGTWKEGNYKAVFKVHTRTGDIEYRTGLKGFDRLNKSSLELLYGILKTIFEK